jgi:flagellar assembly protein FliH
LVGAAGGAGCAGCWRQRTSGTGALVGRGSARTQGQACRAREHHSYPDPLDRRAARVAGQIAEHARDAAVERTLRAAAATVEAFVARQGGALAALEDQLAGAALELAEAILGRELVLATAPGRDAIARAIRLAGEAGQATVRLHPADVATLGQVEGIAPGRELTVVADPAVEPGGCLLEAGATRVDARLGSALERVREVLGS